jgi:hypothetical protein
LRLLCALACALLAVLAALAPAGPAAAAEQEFFFRVLDSRDRPITTAQLIAEPLAGKPENAPPFKADASGVIRLSWVPSASQEGPPGGDRITRWRSAFRWRISAPGHLPAMGSMDLQDKSRHMADPRLAKLNRQAKLASRGETVVLRKTSELFGWPVPEPPEKDPLVRACLAFRAKNARVARRLGAQFAWPAFGKEGSRLNIYFNWTGAPWGSAAPAPLAGRVAALCGLPLLIAAGQELPPLPQVESLRLVFHSSIAPAGDEHALPIPARVIITAPLEQVRRLARGEIRAGAFLADNPPRLERER